MDLAECLKSWCNTREAEAELLSVIRTLCRLFLESVSLYVTLLGVLAFIKMRTVAYSSLLASCVVSSVCARL